MKNNESYATYVDCFKANKSIIGAIAIGNKSVSIKKDILIGNLYRFISHYEELDFIVVELENSIEISW